MNYYVADLHFGHAKIISLTNRPFVSVEQMDQELLNNWNQVVTDNDEVYILGDFLYRSKRPPEYYLQQLRGRKHLLIGNHERWTKQVQLTKWFESVNYLLEITDGNEHLVLCHYPMAEWPRFYRGSLHVFGHIHNNREGDAFHYYLQQPNMFNAGVEINHFVPVTLQQLKMNNKVFRERNDIEQS